MLEDIRRTGERVTAALPEDVDLYTSPELHSAGERLIDDGCRHLVLDLSRVQNWDSTGITVFLSWYQRLAGSGGSLSLTGVGDHLQRVFSRLGLDTFLLITPGAAPLAVQPAGPRPGEGARTAG
ncbi:STAS domain-containing protein [Streptomyces sp. TG1A-8]|uniref:STAS domain-containing protein n=1 Tax=Streptomyces sp. TG1A-8 TaxID=3051385 RepID=UPI00265B92BC|nr:STAS domain-containing protein [Streptomyces sp. TG1A-8]MDO0924311.1 STAS domain-containing protein [Streptomyces sp. TG1A-8]